MQSNGSPNEADRGRGHRIPILDYPSELPEACAGRPASVRPRSRMSHAGSAVGTARTQAVPRQPARMVLRLRWRTQAHKRRYQGGEEEMNLI